MKGLNCGPCGRGCGPSGPYISAYEIAVKHGYQGSERDWIRSIGQWRVIRATQASGNAFECDTLLSDIFADLEHGIVPVLLYEDRVMAFPTEGGDDYIGFGTLMYRDGGTDKYDVYTMSRRGNTVQTRSVSGGGEGGEGWAPGNNSIEYMMLQEDIRASLEKAESAVQPEDLFTIKGYATMSAYQADRGNVRVGDFVLITETGGSNLYRRVETQAATDPELALVYTFAGGSGADIINLASNGIGYAVSPQQLDTAARTAALEGYQLRQNGLVAVRFGSAVEGPNPTLNINNSSAVPMYHNGAALSGGEIRAGATALFVFDGNSYNLLCVDSANRNYGSQNAGKPLVVGQDGTETVGNWPVPGEDGEPVTWEDIVPPAGIPSTDLARLTVVFSENNGVFTASANLYAVMTALNQNKIVDCAMGDYRGELIYAHADEDTSAEFAIFKIVEQVAVYQGQDGEERFPQVRMIYMTHVGATYQLEAIGGRCYVYVTEEDGVYDIDTAATSKIARSIPGLITAFYAGIETRMIVYDGYYNWSHPVSFHYGQAEIRFAGPEAVTVGGRTEIRMVEYTINSSSHVGRTVGSTLPVPASGEPNSPSSDQGKTLVVDGYGRYVLEAPEQELPVPASGDSGKYLKLSGENEPYWGSGPSGSGSSLPATSSADEGKGLFVDANGDIGWANCKPIDITVNNGAASLSMTFAQLQAALQAGRPCHVYAPTDDVHVFVEVRAVRADTQTKTVVFTADTFDQKYSVTLIEVQGAMMGAATVGPSGNVRSPTAVAKTAAEMRAGFAVDANRIYTISGDCGPEGNDGGFAIINSALPAMTPGQCIEIRLVVGSTAITVPTWPGWCNLLNGWDGHFQANTYYKIMIDDAGNVVAGTGEVAA